ncbi:MULTISPECIES: anthranilate synthase family protein [unclassified Pseudofrankia]|uniref:anthranilate synthase family protein n=1 Tax=unclassified Pseudofrankia TaxID=2994372 RepID=UPI0008D956FC|nr:MULTISPECIES: anthranilate synthase family protein [unclassified Pseudofrankia]MDT3443014.1 anthranilate synthase family protein [Pseudofrankia sp. BMG5.37]OHV60754.1 chorismate-binding protein [Pseudofrankia sp. BMG5.36]
MDLFQHLLTAIAAGSDPGPFALLRRENADHLDVLRGETDAVGRLADIPLPSGPAGPRTLAVVPYRQIVERGFTCVDDAAPLECLRVSGHERVPLPAALASLSDEPATATAGRFDVSDEEYAETVGAVLRDEIGRGEGANFVIHRTYTASVVGSPLAAGLAALRRLLTGERGAYWTFLVHTGTRILVGATPERHVSVDDGLVMMNPISGTHRRPDAGAGFDADREALLRFLADRKEIDELYMVLDEELKMMARVAEHGGQVIGPYLKEMSHLTHTEYLLAGRTRLDVREVLRETMFAPTVTGSPLENAFRVIARHEGRPRRYYAGVIALLGHDEAGRQTLDAPILIRAAEISPSGELRVPVGATLVRHSTAAGEVAETYTKAAGVLTALGLRPGPAPGPRPATGTPRTGGAAGAGAADARLAADPRVAAALAARNTHLARFWLEERSPATATVPALAERSALVVDGEDTFTGMLAHQLRGLGLAVTVLPWRQAGDTVGFDLVVPGPGPGDPTLWHDPKMAAMRRIVADLLDRRRPMLAVCLGHQLLAGLLGLRLHRRDTPCQGLAREIDLFGQTRRVGFYSTFTALSDTDEIATPYGVVRLARDGREGGGEVHALRGRTFAGLQFHPESVLSEDGLEILRDLLTELLPAPAHRTRAGTAASGQAT